METGYEDLDKLYSEQNQMMDHEKELQSNIIDKQTQQEVDRMDRQKTEYDKDALKESKGLYSDYRKQSSMYGAEAERRAENGLNNSGYAESSQVNLYNSYQKNVTEVMTTRDKLKAEVDFNINQAYQSADIQKAQTELALYQQKAQLALNMYEYKQQRDQFEWNKYTWQQEFDWNKYTWQQEFEYQKQRDAVSDNQWEKSYQQSRQRSRR